MLARRADPLETPVKRRPRRRFLEGERGVSQDDREEIVEVRARCPRPAPRGPRTAALPERVAASAWLSASAWYLSLTSRTEPTTSELPSRFTTRLTSSATHLIAPAGVWTRNSRWCLAPATIGESSPRTRSRSSGWIGDTQPAASSSPAPSGHLLHRGGVPAQPHDPFSPTSRAKLASELSSVTMR